MWIRCLVLAVLAALASRPVSGNKTPSRTWLDSMTGADIVDVPPVSEAMLEGEPGRASLTFYVKGLTGIPVEPVRIILSAGSGPPVFLTTVAGKVAVNLSWKRSPVQQTVRIKVIATTREPFTVEAVLASVIKQNVPQPWSQVPAQVFNQVGAQLPLILHFPAASRDKQEISSSERVVYEQEFAVWVPEAVQADDGNMPRPPGMFNGSSLEWEPPRTWPTAPQFFPDWLSLSWGEIPTKAGSFGASLGFAQQKNILSITASAETADLSASRLFFSAALAQDWLVDPVDMVDAGPSTGPLRDLQEAADPVFRRLFPFPSGLVSHPDRDMNSLNFGCSLIF